MSNRTERRNTNSLITQVQITVLLSLLLSVSVGLNAFYSSPLEIPPGTAGPHGPIQAERPY
jgi:hypothetical protein